MSLQIKKGCRRARVRGDMTRGTHGNGGSLTLKKAELGHYPSNANVSLYKLAKSKTPLFPWSFQKQHSSVNMLGLTQWDPFHSSDLQNCKKIKLDCFMLPNLYYFVITSVENLCIVFHFTIMILCVNYTVYLSHLYSMTGHDQVLLLLLMLIALPKHCPGWLPWLPWEYLTF